MKSWKKPTPELIERTIVSAIDAERQRYFFNNLKNPLWVKPLSEHSFFKYPPEPVPLDDGSFQIPFWPQSNYLARVAKYAPGEVVEIVEAIQTTNPSIQENILDVALAIDLPDVSARLLKHAINFSKSNFSHWTYDKLGKLIRHWAKIGATKTALDLARAVVPLRPDPRKKEKEEERRIDPHSLFTCPEPQPPCEDYAYRQILLEDIPELANTAPWETVEILVSVLVQAITLSSHEPEKERIYDGSDGWARQFGKPSSYEHSAKSYLAHALFAACTRLLQVSPELFDKLNILLSGPTWHIFSRLRHNLYAHFPTLSKAQMRKEILQANCYYDGEYGHEFALMIKVASDNCYLEPSDLRDIFDDIERGPDLEWFKEFSIKWRNEPPSEEMYKQRKIHFFVKQLRPFKKLLTAFPTLWVRYQQLLNDKVEEPSDEDYFLAGKAEAREVVVKSPATSDILGAKSDNELLKFLNEWKQKRTRIPSDEFSVSGLSKEFSSLLRKDPERFLNIADRFTLEEPTYVRDVLYFASERAKKRQSLPWDKVMDLGKWIVNQSVTIQTRGEEGWQFEWGDIDWTSSRQALAMLIKEGLRDYELGIPWELRQQVFAVLQKLCTDSDPRLDSETSHGNFEKDYLTQAVNSVRGEAVHAMVDHALWVRRQLERNGKKEICISDMPEIREVLENRLSLEHETSLAVRAVYGLLTPWLCHLDTNWFLIIRDKIYPKTKIQMWLAAWTSFIKYTHADKLVFEQLADNYQFAIEHLHEFKQDVWREHPANSLGEHLINLYWWGLVPLTGNRSLLEQFLNTTEPSARAHVMNYIGRALQNSQQVPEDVQKRLKEYWDHRLAVAKEKKDTIGFAEELSDFAWWFKSEKIDTPWCLRQTKEIARLLPKVKELMFFVESLENTAVQYPRESAECMYELIRKRSRDEYFHLDENKIKRILSLALGSKDDEAHKIAEKTQDFLLECGRYEYKHLEKPD